VRGPSLPIPHAEPPEVRDPSLDYGLQKERKKVGSSARALPVHNVNRFPTPDRRTPVHIVNLITSLLRLQRTVDAAK
jgi:hypothetical protein